jgi:hypothetical protein
MMGKPLAFSTRSRGWTTSSLVIHTTALLSSKQDANMFLYRIPSRLDQTHHLRTVKQATGDFQHLQ